MHLQDKVLRKVALEVTFEDPKSLLDLTSDMAVLMYSSGGIGLAAPQVGKSLRVFVMDVIEDSKLYRCFNPNIIDFSTEKSVELEGCLSLPGTTLEIERPVKIKANWQDAYGQHIVADLTGLAARCFQHELDHLNGITIIERNHGFTK